ncbi:MAG TPA: type I glyceraldehyde-3-phosphate dehydrogenase [Bacteroidia bacterium]|jgi:glyceraldehyde 3-phosphate dehydrogenase|nr:type I glyceraldehyde-3-phosphate dehydrogenase [Bacteroidia bacterium]
MTKIKVAINGFGRIGRVTLRALLKRSNIEVVCINDITSASTLAHLFKYDSIHGKFDGTITADDSSFTINGHKIRVTGIKDPATLPWKELGVDVVIESTGLFLDKASAEKHIAAGARKVALSAPAKGTDIKTIVIGINDKDLKNTDTVVSNASCTTNCAAPMAKVIHENWGIEVGFMTTVHAYTSDQRLHDAPHSDLRRARAAALSMVPTSTGAAKAIAEVFPELKGKLTGDSIRVPIPDGSITDFTFIVKKPATVADINAAFKKVSEGALKGVLEYSNEPLVSHDIVGNIHSCIFDSGLTAVIGNLVKISGWYDNESGYSNRLVDLVERMGAN